MHTYSEQKGEFLSYSLLLYHSDDTRYVAEMIPPRAQSRYVSDVSIGSNWGSWFLVQEPGSGTTNDGRSIQE